MLTGNMPRHASCHDSGTLCACQDLCLRLAIGVARALPNEAGPLAAIAMGPKVSNISRSSTLPYLSLDLSLFSRSAQPNDVVNL